MPKHVGATIHNKLNEKLAYLLVFTHICWQGCCATRNMTAVIQLSVGLIMHNRHKDLRRCGGGAVTAVLCLLQGGRPHYRPNTARGSGLTCHTYGIQLCYVWGSRSYTQLHFTSLLLFLMSLSLLFQASKQGCPTGEQLGCYAVRGHICK
jgi:hypothetical protein